MLGSSNPNHVTNVLHVTVKTKGIVHSIVYQATVTLENPENSDNPENVYFGICEGSFKPRYRNHLKSFNNRRYETDTELSEYIWKLKDRGMSYSIKWDIKSRASPYKCGTNRCDLCVTEKVIIARCNHKGLLNKRSELMNKCRHRNKFILKNFWPCMFVFCMQFLFV